MLINKLGFSIPLTDLTELELKELKENLIFKANVIEAYDFGQAIPFKMYRMSEKKIYIPKFYGLSKYGLVNKHFKNKGSEITCEFNGTPLPHQKDYCDTLLNNILKNDSCVAYMTTGGGKTFCALYLASKLNAKSLIIVHKSFLAQQWHDRIKQFFPSAKIGLIQQDKCEIEGKDFVIAMIQTIISRDFSPSLFDSIKFTIYDEAHHISAASFSQVLFITGSRYSLGLSATPNRKDGLTNVLTYCLGEIIPNNVTSDIETPIVEFINAEYSTKIVPKYNFKSQLNAPNLINQLVLDPKRNEQIVDKIILLSKTDRKILVISGRRNHCFKLNEMLISKCPFLKIGIYLGGMKQEELDKSILADIIISSYNMIAEAFDCPKLDSIILCTGISDVTQTIGRILRRKNANRPLVVDVTDKEFFMGQSKRRTTFYKNNKYLLNSSSKEICSKQLPEKFMFT
jgi:superfamily II DNA or RNA helicase